MTTQSKKPGQPSKPGKRPLAADIIDFSESSSPVKRPHTAAGPSRHITGPIMIDGDGDDDDEEAAFYEVEYGAPKKERRPSPKGENEDVGGIDQFEARDAVRVALRKLETEVSV
jgi:hypothetical protein